MTTYITGGPPRFNHQKRGLQKMIATGGVTALLFDPGTGKTATVLDYAGLLTLKSKSREVRMLVVCPLAAVDTWVLQTEQFITPQIHYWSEVVGGSIRQRGETLAARGGSPFKNTVPTNARHHPRALHHHRSILWRARGSEQRPRPITMTEGPDGLGDDKPKLIMAITNIDTFTSRASMGNKTVADFIMEAVHRFNPDLLVVDESHKIKSAQGNASRLLARIAPSVQRRVILTGTVMPHSPLDVFGQWRFLDPYAFGTMNSDGSRKKATFGTFKNRFAIMGGFMGHEVTGYRNLDDMQKIMATNAIVARKEDAVDLPATSDVEIPVELSSREKKVYREMKANLAVQLSSVSSATASNRLTQMMRLRQVTSGHLPDDNGNLQVIGHSKVNTIKSLVEDTLAGEKRIVIFALFTHEISMLQTALAKQGTEVMVISGGTDSKDRMAMRKRFGSDDPARMVMVAQIKTMSLAVNELVTANHAIFGSLSQQRDDLVQARDRLNRIGQTRPVTFWYALAPGTIDTVIMQSHRDRTDLEDAMLRHIKGEEDEDSH